MKGAAEISACEDGLRIIQQTDRAVLHWEDFSIEAGKTVHVLQPSCTSALLSQVVGTNPSKIYGSLLANGQIFLINPHGILVGPDGMIQVGGFLGATKLLNDDAFMNGGDLALTGDSWEGIVNLGKIECLHGDLVLIGTYIDNPGSLEALQGNVEMAAGADVLLQIEGSRRLFIRSNMQELETVGGNPYSLAVRQTSKVRADRVHLLSAGAIAVEGHVEARADESRILVLGGQEAVVKGHLIAEGGFIEISAPRISYEYPAVCEKLLLDPYDIQIATVDPGGAIISWVDAGALSATLDVGTAVTVNTAGCAGCTMLRSAVEPGDITVVDFVSTSSAGAGLLTLIADQNIIVNAPLSNFMTGGGFTLNAVGTVSVNQSIFTTDQPISITAGTGISTAASISSTSSGGDITLTSTTGNITIGAPIISTQLDSAGTGAITVTATAGSVDFGTAGTCEVRNVNSLLQVSALNSILLNSGGVLASAQLGTFGQNINIISTNGPIFMAAPTPGVSSNSGTSGGTITLQTTATGDITFVGVMNGGPLNILAGAGGNVWIGNDAAGTFSSGIQTVFERANPTPDLMTISGDNVTFRAGAGVGEGIIVQNRGDLTVTASNGNIEIFGGSQSGGAIDLRTATAGVTHAYSATGFMHAEAGSNSGCLVQLGPSGLGSGTGTLNITVTGTDLTLQGGSFDDVVFSTNTDGANIDVARDFLISGGSQLNTQATFLVSGFMFPQAMLTVARDMVAQGGTGTSAGAQISFGNVDFTISRNLHSIGGSGASSFGAIYLTDLMAGANTIGNDILAQGGSNDDASAQISLSGSGSSFSTGNDLSILAGTGLRANASLSFDAQTIDVGHDFTMTGDVASAFFNASLSGGTMTLLVHNQAALSGGIGSLDPSSTGEATLVVSSGGLHMEVVADLTITGGTAADANGQISCQNFVTPGNLEIFVGQDINILPGAGSFANGIYLITANVVPSMPLTWFLDVEAGGNISVTGGPSSASYNISAGTLIDLTGMLFPPFVLNAPGPTTFIRSLGSIISTNGTGTTPAGLANLDASNLPFPVPPGGVVCGDVTIQAAGDLQFSSGIRAGSPLGGLNLTPFIYAESNHTFPAGALWPGNLILGVSPATSLPNGAISSVTGTFANTVDFMTTDGNISLLSAENNLAVAPVNLTSGAAPDNFRFFTTSGNLLLEGFADININQAFTTIGNASFVAPATEQIFIRAFQDVSTTGELSVTGASFGIRMVADKDLSGVQDINLGADVTAHAASGTVILTADTGAINQTAGTVSAYTLNFTADNGITNTILPDLALRTAGTLINAVNAITGELNLYNTLAGPNTISSSVTLANGTGAASAGRTVFFAQHGGASVAVQSALADGNLSLLAYDGLANLTLSGTARAGDNLIGMAFQNMTIDTLGQARSAMNLTLIIDEAYGTTDGQSSFSVLNNVDGLISDLGLPNIAIYACGGPQTPAGFTSNPLTTFGNQTTIPTWDIATPSGLASKYATSWQGGGAYHGAGFGTSYSPGAGVFGSPVVWYKSILQIPGPSLAASPLLGLEMEVFQALSLLDYINPWGEEIAFSLSSPQFQIRRFCLINDRSREHKILDPYDRFSRRKFVHD